MSANDALTQVRTVLSYIGSALILIALLKFAGITSVNLRGDFWQIAILGWALRGI